MDKRLQVEIIKPLYNVFLKPEEASEVCVLLSASCSLIAIGAKR